MKIILAFKTLDSIEIIKKKLITEPATGVSATSYESRSSKYCERIENYYFSM